MFSPSPWATCIAQTIPVQCHVISTVIQISSCERPNSAGHPTAQMHNQPSPCAEKLGSPENCCLRAIPSYLCLSGLRICTWSHVILGPGAILVWISKSRIFAEYYHLLLWDLELLFCRCILFKNVRSLFEESDQHGIYMATWSCKIRLFNQKNVSSPKQIINFLAFFWSWIKDWGPTII